jgi:hypothetical protein
MINFHLLEALVGQPHCILNNLHLKLEAILSTLITNKEHLDLLPPAGTHPQKISRTKSNVLVPKMTILNVKGNSKFIFNAPKITKFKTKSSDCSVALHKHVVALSEKDNTLQQNPISFFIS